jgi:hypothetical protein
MTSRLVRGDLTVRAADAHAVICLSSQHCQHALREVANAPRDAAGARSKRRQAMSRDALPAACDTTCDPAVDRFALHAPISATCVIGGTLRRTNKRPSVGRRRWRPMRSGTLPWSVGSRWIARLSSRCRRCLSRWVPSWGGDLGQFHPTDQGGTRPPRRSRASR